VVEEKREVDDYCHGCIGIYIHNHTSRTDHAVSCV